MHKIVPVGHKKQILQPDQAGVCAAGSLCCDNSAFVKDWCEQWRQSECQRAQRRAADVRSYSFSDNSWLCSFVFTVLLVCCQLAKDYLGLCKSNNLIYWCVYSFAIWRGKTQQTLIPPQAQKPMWTFGLELTGALDGDFQLPSAGSFCVNLEVCSLLHPEALWLQTTTLGSAEAGVTRCGQTERVRLARRRVTLWPHFSGDKTNEVWGEWH